MTKKSSPNLPVVRTSILKRAALQNILFALCIVVVLTTISFLIARAFLENRVVAQLSSIVTAKEDLVERALQHDREQTALLSLRPEFSNILIRKNSSDTFLKNFLEQMMGERIAVRGITVFDESQRNIVSSGEPIVPLADAMNGTVVRPVLTDNGWQSYVIYSPVTSNGNRIGTLGVLYDTENLLNSLLSVSFIGETGEVLLGKEEEGTLMLLHHDHSALYGRPVFLGDLTMQTSYGSPLALAVSGTDGLGKSEDYTGQNVFAAYRSLSSLDWGLVVKVDRNEALQGTRTLALFLSIAGAALALGTGLLGFLLAQGLTRPIVDLSRKMKRLGPGHWGFRHTVKSGDEVEVLDFVVADLAKRLKTVYDHQEEEIEKRTKELKEQYVKDRAILETVEYGVVLADQKGNIVDANPYALHMLHMKLDAVVGHPSEKILSFCHKREECVGKKHPLLRVLKNRKSFRADNNAHMSLRASDDTLAPVSLVVTPLVVGKKLIGAIAVFQDMTNERRMDYIKSEFISLASHQLRTPISSIQWYLELFADQKEHKLSTVQKESIKEMKTATDRMSSLVEALLRAAQLEGGTIDPKLEKVDVADLLRTVAEELRSLAKDSKISCTIDVPQKSIHIATDPVLLHVVFQNLFSNAVKYSKQGCNIAVRFVRKAKNIEVTVKDTGIGIPRGQQPRVFERLFRANNAVKVDTDGNGLGLYISKMIVEILGGSISFVSNEGKGTTFTVKLPIKRKKS